MIPKKGEKGKFGWKTLPTFPGPIIRFWRDESPRPAKISLIHPKMLARYWFHRKFAASPAGPLSPWLLRGRYPRVAYMYRYGC